jgi:hypothetical protein
MPGSPASFATVGKAIKTDAITAELRTRNSMIMGNLL